MVKLLQSLLCLVLSTLILAATNDDPLALKRYRGHVKIVDGKYEIVTALADAYTDPDTSVEDVPASAFWDEGYNVTGWSVLEIETYSNQTDIDQAYSAGLIEGRLTRGKIIHDDRNRFDDDSL